MTRNLVLCVAVLLVSGCKFRMALREQPVESVGVRFDREGMCPGESSQLTVFAKLKDGQVLESENTDQGKVRWDSYRVLLNGQPIEEGVVVVPADPRQVTIPSRLDIGVDGHPNVKGSWAVPIHFKCAFVANFQARDGRSGAEGQNGQNGEKGQDGKTYSVPGKSGFQHDPGGNGGDGRDGTNGGDGEPASDAEDVDVRVSMGQPTPDLRLLQVKVTGLVTRKEQLFLVDPNGGSLTIYANGGRGGSGGQGGHGGRGGDAGSGEPKGTAGNGGNGGDGGNGADGGRGGKVTITATASAQAYLSAIKVINQGGAGGVAGAPGSGGYNGAFGSNSPRNGRAGQGGNRGGRAGMNGPKPEIRIEGN